MQYSTGNSYLPDCGGYVFSVAILLRWCSVPPPSIARTCFFYPWLCNACAGWPKSPGKTRTNISVPVSLPFSTLSYPSCSPYCCQPQTISTMDYSQLYRISSSSSGCSWERVWR